MVLELWEIPDHPGKNPVDIRQTEISKWLCDLIAVNPQYSFIILCGFMAKYTSFTYKPK